jgi:hypothetical protein
MTVYCHWVFNSAKVLIIFGFVYLLHLSLTTIFFSDHLDGMLEFINGGQDVPSDQGFYMGSEMKEIELRRVGVSYCFSIFYLLFILTSFRRWSKL